jgi:hypothetical protein
MPQRSNAKAAQTKRNASLASGGPGGVKRNHRLHEQQAEGAMTLHLVIHSPPAPAGSPEEAAIRSALQEAVWEIADSHWSPADGSLLVATDLSPAYLVQHFRSGLGRRGCPDPGLLLVVPVTDTAAWTGLPKDAEAWLKDVV